MRAMITDAADYFARGCGRCARFDTADCSTRLWAPALGALRCLCLEAGLEEAAKWGHPCYMHAGRNIALINAFRGHIQLSLFNAALLSDPAGLLVRQGPNTRHPDTVRFTDASEVAARGAAVTALLRQAMDFAGRGIRAPREPHDLDLPDELIEALDADAALAEAFHALTPGRQRSYAIALSSTAVPATRLARIERLRPRILGGKGATER